MSGNTFNSDILIAGAIAAFTVDLLVYPLDTLKTRIQSPDYARLYTNSVTGKPNPALFRGVYQGIGSVVIATLPSSGAFFTTYEQFKDLFTRINPSTAAHPNGLIPAPFIHSGASGLAELVSCAILTPAEVIKQNAQMVSANSPTNATIQTLAKFKSNPLALWRGYTALASRNLPFTALQFPMFERLKERIHKYRDDQGLSTGTVVESGTITAVSAGAAGSVAAVITTPIDVIKTRIMLAAAEEGASAAEAAASQKPQADGLVDAFGKTVKPTKVSVQGAVQALNPMAPPKKRNGRKSSWQIGKEVIHEQGWRGIWRGGALRGVWTFVGSGLYLGAYESGRVYLANRRGEKLGEAEMM